ncbi:espin-like protein [Protopterus annectens]|uniref:espin-like protein n=1 Tax=Protopterus annectens TaxID=7888 RepID=UPI001CFA9541|nr:espin-like protein [Protopterus annectens]
MAPHRALLAAKDGDLLTLKNLLDAQTLDVDVADEQGATPVHHAARTGKFDCLQFLVLEAKLPGNQRAKNGASPAHDAAATGNLAELKFLIESGGCSLQDRDASGATVLHLAVRFGRLETIQWLLQAGCDPTLVTESGAISAHYAAAKGDLTCLKLLTEHAPSSVDKQTISGATPVYLACQEGHLPIVEFLVKDCKASISLRTWDGMTVLHAAIQMGHEAVTEWLISFTNIDLCAQDKEGATVLHYAASGGHTRILNRLLHTGAKIMNDHWGGTPLHDAAENGEMECCQMLILSGVDSALQDEDGYTAADLAEYNGHVDCANYLRQFIPIISSQLGITESSTKETDHKPKTAVTTQQSAGEYCGVVNEKGPTKGIENGKDHLLVNSVPPQQTPVPLHQVTASSPTVLQQATKMPRGKQMNQLSPGKQATNMMKKTGPKKPLLDLKALHVKSIKKAGITAMFKPLVTQKQVDQSHPAENGFVPLEVVEMNLADVDSLVPTHDEKGRPIPEWKRQVMVRKLQARLEDEEAKKTKVSDVIKDYIIVFILQY